MKLINAEYFNIVTCENATPEFIDGMAYMLDRIDNAPIALDTDVLCEALLDYSIEKGILIKDPIKAGRRDEYSTFISINEVLRIIHDHINKSQ